MEHTKDKSGATLDAIPKKLFTNISEHLRPKDLKSLRLVSRQCAEKVIRAYTDELFSDYAFCLFDENSISRALQAAKHPRFGLSVRTLSILCDSPKDISWVKRKVPKSEWWSFAQLIIAEDPHVEHRDETLSLLTTLLCFLNQCHPPGEVIITDRSHWKYGRRGSKRYQMDYLDKATAIVIEALSLSNMKPSRFAMTKLGHVTTEAFNPDHCRRAFKELESLRVEVLNNPIDALLGAHDELLFLAQAKRLEHVHYSGHLAFPSLLLQTRLPAVKTVTIEMNESELILWFGCELAVSLKQLCDFVSMQPTLTTLNLQRTSIRDCYEYLHIDKPRIVRERDGKKLQEILGVCGSYEEVTLLP